MTNKDGGHMEVASFQLVFKRLEIVEKLVFQLPKVGGIEECNPKIMKRKFRPANRKQT